MSFTIQETCKVSTRVQVPVFLFRRNNIEGIQFLSLVPIDCELHLSMTGSPTFKKYSPTNECITKSITSHQRNKIHNIPVAQRPSNAFSLKIRIMCNAHSPILQRPDHIHKQLLQKQSLRTDDPQVIFPWESGCSVWSGTRSLVPSLSLDSSGPALDWLGGRKTCSTWKYFTTFWILTGSTL